MSPDNPVAQWVQLHGEEHDVEIRRSLGRDAKEAGLSPNEMAEAYLDEYRAAHEGAVITGIDGSEHPIEDDQSSAEPAKWFTGGSSAVVLPRADRKGDFFYHDSSSWGYDHGHNGLYRWKGMVVEAANSNRGVTRTRIYKKSTGEVLRKVPKGTYILYRKHLGPWKRDVVTWWANDKVGADYRAWWKVNRTASAPYNCSQLIWAAYKRANIELDPDDESRGTWNKYVYPIEIATGRYTYYYDRA